MFGAIDIGGTKTLMAAFDDAGKLVQKITFPTPGDYNSFIDSLAGNFKTLGPNSYKAVTVAVPGKIDRNRGVAIAFGNLDWHNVSIRDDIEGKLSNPIIIENDAKLAGLYEAIQFPKFRKVLYITVSTGIGCGLIINGSIDPDFDDMEAGQMLLEHENRLERWENFASGKAIVAKYGKPASELNDPNAWHEIARNLAIGMIDLIALLTPDLIVIGGGVGSHFEKFSNQLNEELMTYANDLLKVPPIYEATNPEEAVAYGCYYLGKSIYEHKNN
jgi:predicted NBD/HSP70 family sugar kinase